MLGKQVAFSNTITLTNVRRSSGFLKELKWMPIFMKSSCWLPWNIPLKISLKGVLIFRLTSKSLKCVRLNSLCYSTHYHVLLLLEDLWKYLGQGVLGRLCSLQISRAKVQSQSDLDINIKIITSVLRKWNILHTCYNQCPVKLFSPKLITN